MINATSRSVYSGSIDKHFTSIVSLKETSMINADNSNDNGNNMKATTHTLSSVKSSSSSLQFICNEFTLKETKERRAFTQEKEEQGAYQIYSSLTEEEKELLGQDYNACLRHYRADKGDITKAVKRTKYAINWRKRTGVNEMLEAVHGDYDDNDERFDELRTLKSVLREEGETGKVYSRGYDKEGRAIMYFYPVRENTKHNKNNIKHLVYQIERAIAASEKNGCEKVIIIMDFVDWTMKKAAPMSVTKETIHILQDCYVERMYRVYMTNTPLMFRTFWGIVKPFIDPVTKEKIVFCSGKKSIELMKRDLHMNVLEKSAFGTETLRDYDSKEYFALPLDTVFDEKE